MARQARNLGLGGRFGVVHWFHPGRLAPERSILASLLSAFPYAYAL